jgi:hypothetical protein
MFSASHPGFMGGKNPYLLWILMLSGWLGVVLISCRAECRLLIWPRLFVWWPLQGGELPWTLRRAPVVAVSVYWV